MLLGMFTGHWLFLLLFFSDAKESCICCYSFFLQLIRIYRAVAWPFLWVELFRLWASLEENSADELEESFGLIFKISRKHFAGFFYNIHHKTLQPQFDKFHQKQKKKQQKHMSRFFSIFENVAVCSRINTLIFIYDIFWKFCGFVLWGKRCISRFFDWMIRIWRKFGFEIGCKSYAMNNTNMRHAQLFFFITLNGKCWFFSRKGEWQKNLHGQLCVFNSFTWFSVTFFCVEYSFGMKQVEWNETEIIFFLQNEKGQAMTMKRRCCKCEKSRKNNSKYRFP